MLKRRLFLGPLPGLPSTWNMVHVWCSNAPEAHRGNAWHVAKGKSPCVESIWRVHQEGPGISAFFPFPECCHLGFTAMYNCDTFPEHLSPAWQIFFFIFKPSVYKTERISKFPLVLLLVQGNPPSVAYSTISSCCTPHSPLRPHNPSLCPFRDEESRAEGNKTNTTQLLSSRARIQALVCLTPSQRMNQPVPVSASPWLYDHLDLDKAWCLALSLSLVISVRKERT